LWGSSWQRRNSLGGGRAPVIPRIVHFVFGLREQTEPFHLLHAVAIESARRYLAPEEIHFHYKELPWGPHFERVRPHLTMHEVDLVPEILGTDYDPDVVPDRYHYAHHADFIRLNALIEYGGVYADIDTVFVAEFPDILFEAPFVIGQEGEVTDPRTGELRPSLCNALLMSEPGSEFATRWRDEMPSWLDGSWSNHSGFLAHELAGKLADKVRVEPRETFFPFSFTPDGLAALLEREEPLPPGALSVHLWAHLWWERDRLDFSGVHAGRLTAPQLARARTTLASLVRPFLPPAPARRGELGRWRYISLDEASGYGYSARDCREALEAAGVDVEWAPYYPSPGGRLWYGPEPALGTTVAPDVVVAHVVPEYLESIRADHPDAYLVAHTVWETDQVPRHWPACLEWADLILTQSRSSAEALSNSTTTPVAVVPSPVVCDDDGPSSAWEWIEPETTVFYTIAEWNARKAIDRTVEAFLRAFTKNDRVLLIVKTSPRDHTAPLPREDQPREMGTTAWALAGVMAGRDDYPAVALDTRPLPAVDIEALHRRGDCFVSLARGEGWGMGAFSAAARGTPVVTTAYGGHLDYLGGSPGLVDYHLVPVDDPAATLSYSPDQRWAEPNVDHAAQLLRAVVTDPTHRQWATQRGHEIQSRYRPERVADAFVEAISVGRRRHGPNHEPVITTGIRWLGLAPGSGFGDAAEMAIAGLRDAGIPVTWSPLGWAENEWGAGFGPLTRPGLIASANEDLVGLRIDHDTVVVHSTPVWNTHLENEAKSRRVVAYTTWEHDRLPETYVEILNHYDLVLVSSRFNAETFMASGVTAPVMAVPHISRPVEPVSPIPPRSQLVFYTIGTWTTRKALGDTIRAYLSAFKRSDDVTLIVATTEEDLIGLRRIADRGWAIDPQEGRSWFELERLLAERSDHPQVELRTAQMTRSEIDSLHATSHCFISLTRCEGWGLGAFDAAARGNPVVTTGWGGTLDFLPSDYPYLVDFDLVPSRDDETDIWAPSSDGYWAKARIAHGAELLRSVYEDREAAWAAAARHAPGIRARFDSATATSRLLATLGRVPVPGPETR
jgi:glycosyltransferase involved in cell wall biosynthesis